MATATTDTVPTVSESVKAKAKAAIGAIGVWAEWMEGEGKRYFTDTLTQAEQALTLVKPNIVATRAAWGKAEAKPEDKFTFDHYVKAIAIMTDWEPDDEEIERARTIYTLAVNDHAATTKAHYLKVTAANPASFTLDMPSYLKWLPKRGEYVNGVRTQEAIDAEQAKRDANAAQSVRERDVVLCSDHSWVTLVENAATDTDRVKRLLALAHDLLGYAEREADKLGDDEAAALRREVNKQVRDKANAKPASRKPGKGMVGNVVPTRSSK